jgi:uncharacterized membrane protein YhaH (DUF805 family)
MDDYLYLSFGVLMLLMSIVFIYSVFRRDMHDGKQPIWNYLLLWPLLIEQHKRKASQESNRFIFSGLIIMVILVVIDLLFLA